MKFLKGTFLSIFMLIIYQAIFAQSQNWQWVVEPININSSAYTCDGITTDSNGYSYITGKVQNGSVDMGGTIVTSGNTYIAKLDSDGNWLWVETVYCSLNLQSLDVAFDAESNVYITGSLWGSATFGDITITSTPGQHRIFIAKLNNTRTWEWAKVVTGGYSYGYGIQVAGNNCVFLVGFINDSVAFGSTILTSNGAEDIVVAKLDSNGNWLWAKKAGNTGSDVGRGIVLDIYSNIFITGDFAGTVSFGDTSLTSSGLGDVFCAKLDTNGNWIWAKKAGGLSSDLSHAIAIDDLSNVYITGYYYAPESTFGSIILQSYGSIDVFVSKLDSNGNWLWANSAGGSYGDQSYSVVVDNSTNVYITGDFHGLAHFGDLLVDSGSDESGGQIFVAKLDSSGNWDMVKNTYGYTYRGNTSKVISIDNEANLYICGQLTGGVLFGDLPASGAMYGGSFVAKLTSDPIIQLQTSNSINFGTMYINEPSEYQSAVISNKGGSDITISEIHYNGTPLHFEHYNLANLILEPGEVDTLFIRFTPQAVGALSDDLWIVNNSVNEEIIRIRLSGVGLSVLPKTPQNLNILMIGNDAHLTWDPVTENEHNLPYAPDFYLVFVSTDPLGTFTYLGATPGLQYTHFMVGAFNPRMFYRVTAYKFDGRGAVNLSELGLQPGMPEEQVMMLLKSR